MNVPPLHCAYSTLYAYIYRRNSAPIFLAIRTISDTGNNKIHRIGTVNAHNDILSLIMFIEQNDTYRNTVEAIALRRNLDRRTPMVLCVLYTRSAQ